MEIKLFGWSIDLNKDNYIFRKGNDIICFKENGNLVIDCDNYEINLSTLQSMQTYVENDRKTRKSKPIEILASVFKPNRILYWEFQDETYALAPVARTLGAFVFSPMETTGKMHLLHHEISLHKSQNQLINELEDIAKKRSGKIVKFII